LAFRVLPQGPYREENNHQENNKERDEQETTMKTTSRLNWSLIAAIGGVLSAAAAYGQTKITAEIPFSFRTAAGVQAAGQYAVIPAGLVGDVLANQSVETGRTTLLGIGARDSANETRARLVFYCGSQTPKIKLPSRSTSL
jgi:hypothetical protein